MRTPTPLRRVLILGSLMAVLSLVGTTTASALVIFNLNMDGAQEAPGPGDPDGLATGWISFNDMTGTIAWNITYENIAAPTAMHIHGPSAPVGVPAPVFIGLGVATSGGPGTLIDSITNIALIPQINQILATPTDFYVNIHNADFGPGAVRGQLGDRVPEPSTLLILGVGLLGVARARRRRR